MHLTPLPKLSVPTGLSVLCSSRDGTTQGTCRRASRAPGAGPAHKSRLLRSQAGRTRLEIKTPVRHQMKMRRHLPENILGLESVQAPKFNQLEFFPSTMLVVAHEHGNLHFIMNMEHSLQLKDAQEVASSCTAGWVWSSVLRAGQGDRGQAAWREMH